jgi:3'(2'), 5'-bisphosphate nucleotidase
MINHQEIIKLISEAGNLVLSYYNKSVSLEYKPDSSPVTEVDIKSHFLIENTLKTINSNIIVVSEECQDHSCIDHEKIHDFWLVDPLDGTEGFLKRNDHFTINIAYMVNKKPKYGFIMIPTKNEIYFNDDENSYLISADGQQRVIKTRKVSPKGCDAIMSSKLTQPTLELLKQYHPRSIEKIGSAIKFCYIAKGSADLYLRHGTTMEWDTAAGDAILRKAGGSVTDLNGSNLEYCKPCFQNGPFIARGKF